MICDQSDAPIFPLGSEYVISFDRVISRLLWQTQKGNRIDVADRDKSGGCYYRGCIQWFRGIVHTVENMFFENFEKSFKMIKL